MDIDKMFKLPSIPSGKGAKRKLPDLPAGEVLKRFKPDDNGNSDGQHARVEDETSGGDPLHMPDGPTPHQVEDGDDGDEEGRFFGGGLNEEQNQILDIFDRADDVDTSNTLVMSAPAVRRLVGRFQRVVSKNAEQRGQYPDDPTKFIDSEADVDATLKQFLPMTQNPSISYPELVSSGAVGLFANLLSHENTDIAIDVVEVLQELTDEDIGDEETLDVEDEEANEAQKTPTTRLALAQLIDELLSNSIFQLLVSNLKRLNEDEETDRQGVFHILGLFENLLTFMPPLAEQVVSTTSLLPWLLERLKTTAFDSNKLYASEILSIIVQHSLNAEKAVELDAIEVLLNVIASYRQMDPNDAEEMELMENAFDSLCAVVALPKGKRLFCDAEGVELMLLIMKRKRLSSLRAIKVLNYAFQTAAGASGCERFVEVRGLKSLFPFFMGKTEKKHVGAMTFEDNEHIVGLLGSLFTSLGSDSPSRLRLIAKFVEGDYEKVDRLLEIRESAQNKLRATEKRISDERTNLMSVGGDVDELQEEQWYLDRLESGLFALQAVDYVLGWICMEDDGIKYHAESLLSRQNQSLGDVAKVLQERLSHFELSADEDEDEDEDAGLQRKILRALVTFLAQTTEE